MREIRELLEKAETKLLCTDDRLRPLGDIQQALTLLKQQPPVSDFTKKVRLDLENWTSALGINADVRVATVVGWLKEALKIIDRAEASKAELLKACKRAKRFIRNGIELGYIKMPDIETDPAHETLPIIEVAIAKATGEE